MSILFSLLLLLQAQNPALAAEYIVGPQDRLAITVFDEPTLTKTAMARSIFRWSDESSQAAVRSGRSPRI